MSVRAVHIHSYEFSNSLTLTSLLHHSLEHHSNTGTSKADVFSFAVVMYEIFVRHLPYESPHIATPVVIAQVAAGRLRPTLPSDMEKSVSDLLKQCWEQNPEKRPSFNECIKKLNKAYKACRNSGKISPFSKDRRRPSLLDGNDVVEKGEGSKVEEDDVIVVGEDNSVFDDEKQLMEPLLEPSVVV